MGLSRRQSDRPATAGAFVALLVTALRDPSPGPARVRHPAPSAGTLVLAALALLAFVMGVYRITRPAPVAPPVAAPVVAAPPLRAVRPVRPVRAVRRAPPPR
jgi:hypothetical protein